MGKYQNKQKKTGNQRAKQEEVLHGKDPKGSETGDSGRYEARKPRRKTTTIKDNERSGSFSLNNPSWYNFNPDEINTAGLINFANKMGKPLILNNERSNTFDDTASLVAPGLMSIEWIPSIGKADSVNSTINVAGQQIYKFMRQVESGSTNGVQYVNILVYLLAMDSIYAGMAFIRRLFGLTNAYAYKNNYMPRAYFKACGVDYDDLIENKNKYITMFNDKIVNLVATMPCPAEIPYFLRHSYMSDNIYVDEASVGLTSQQYMFVPRNLWSYYENTTTGVQLQSISWIPTNGNTVKLSVFINRLYSMIDNMQNSDNVDLVQAGITKAYGNGNLYMVPKISEDYSVVPVFDPMIQQQIETAWVIDGDYSDLDVKEAVSADLKPYLKFEPKVTVDTSYNLKGSMQPMFNTHMGWPQPLDLAYATRLCPCIASHEATDTVTVYTFGETGTEIPVSFKLWTSLDETDLRAGRFGTVIMVAPTSAASHIKTLNDLASFNWHPIVHNFVLNTESGKFEYKGTNTDLALYNKLEYSMLDDLHSVCLKSLWRIPSFGVFKG